MLDLFLALAIQLTYNPKISQTAQGSYFELVKTGYDPAVNRTYGVFERYDRDLAGNYPVIYTYVINLPGQLTSQQVMDAEYHYDYVHLVDSTK